VRCIAVIVLALGAGLGAAERVEIVNPGFERDADGNGIPDGWGRAIHGEGFEIAMDGDRPFEGARAVRITGLPGHGDRACVLQTTQLHQLPEAGYCLNLAVRGAGVATAIFRLKYTSPDGAESEVTHHLTIADVPADAWAERAYDFPVPDEVRAVGIARAEVILYQRGEGDLFYDAVRIDKLTVPTPPAG